MQLEQPGSRAVIGSGNFTYDVIDDFARIPAGMKMQRVTAVACDKDDNLFVFSRDATAPIMIFDKKGNFVASWGDGEFTNPHALHIGRDNMIYCTDDFGHFVRKYTLDGKPLLTIGIPGQGSQPYSGDPFCRCTHTALSPENDIYISDGYWNARVHKYSQEGKHILSWGRPGRGPGEFDIAHNIGCDDAGFVYIADRENHRVQVFNGSGEFEAEMKYVHRPCGLAVDMSPDGYCYAGELGPGFPTTADAPNLGPRITILSKDGKVVARIAHDPASPATTQIYTPHSMCFDSNHDMFIGDPMSEWALRNPNTSVPHDRGGVKKLVRRK